MIDRFIVNYVCLLSVYIEQRTLCHKTHYTYGECVAITQTSRYDLHHRDTLTITTIKKVVSEMKGRDKLQTLKVLGVNDLKGRMKT